MRNGLAMAGTFFKQWESHKISYRIGQHKTELDLLVVIRQQMCRVRDCMIIVDEHGPLGTCPWCLLCACRRG